MIFLELENGLVELTGALFYATRAVAEPDGACSVIVRPAAAPPAVTLLTGTADECRAVLSRIIEKLEHVNREVVIRRASYLPETTP